MQLTHRYIYFYTTHSCQNLPPALPTMQFKYNQFIQRFRCVMLLAANVACSRLEEWASMVW